MESNTRSCLRILSRFPFCLRKLGNLLFSLYRFLFSISVGLILFFFLTYVGAPSLILNGLRWFITAKWHPL